MEAIRVSERRLYRRIYAGITTCIDSTPLTITHSMIRTPLPSGEAPKSWVGEKPLLSVSTFFQQPPPPRSSISGKDEQMAKTDMAVSSSATLLILSVWRLLK
ncbi:unnamed protein product [Brassica oleracea var. botrytis]